MVTFNYPRDLIEPLRSAWSDRLRYELDPPELPGDEFLLSVLETAYHASFTLDEQRRTRLTLIVCDSESEDAVDALRFLETRELNVHELMRLGPVAADDRAVIGITPPQEGQPRIWGLCTRGYLQLTVSIVGPGALELGRGGVTRVALRGGRIDSGSSDGSWSSLGKFLASANTALWEGVNWGGGSWSPEYVVYLQRVWDIATAIARGGHGGTLLVIPDGDADAFLEHKDWIRIKYACNDNSLWNKMKVAIRRYDDETFVDPKGLAGVEAAEKEVEHLTARIGQLAAVDGAVLMTDRMRLLGFGAEVTVHSDVAQVMRGDGTSVPIEAFGTRHRAAFRFLRVLSGGSGDRLLTRRGCESDRHARGRRPDVRWLNDR
jgi:hypothetical protein